MWLVTDLDPRDSVDAADRTYAETHRVAGRMGRVRAADVQSYLRAEFGPPLRTIRTEAATPAWEEIFAELYAKVTPDTSTTRDP